MRKLVILVALVVLAGALGAAAHAADGPMSPLTAGLAPDSLAPWLHPPTPMTWSCQQIPNLPAPTRLICGTTSSPASCSGKVIYDAVCGVAGGYCLYCWQGSGPPDAFGNYPCDCRN
jgi:hypothetical protein